MSDEPRAPLQVSSRMANRLPTLAARLGLNAEQLCRRHGLNEATLQDRTGRVPLDSVLAGLEDMIDQTGNRSLGLELAMSAGPNVYHTPGLVLLASDSLKEGFVRAFELQRLWGDGDRFAVAAAAEVGLSEGFVVTFRIPSRRRRGHGILEVCALAETMTAARSLTGRQTEPALAVGLPSTTDDIDTLTSFFGVVPRLSEPCAYLVLDERTVDIPLLHAHRMFRQIFERQAQEELLELPPNEDFLASVRAEILRGLARGRATLDDCAVTIGLSRRTFERRLAERGCGFQELVDSARKSRTLQLLGTGLSVEETAALLGYSERSSFHRACLRWFGKTPTEVRLTMPEPKTMA